MAAAAAAATHLLPDLLALPLVGGGALLLVDGVLDCPAGGLASS